MIQTIAAYTITLLAAGYLVYSLFFKSKKHKGCNDCAIYKAANNNK